MICHQLFSPSYRPEISNQLTCEYLIPDTGAQECDFPEDVGLPTEQGLGAIRLIGHVLQNKQTIGRLAASCVNFCSRVTARVDSINRPFIEWTYFFLFHFLLALMSSLWPPPSLISNPRFSYRIPCLSLRYFPVMPGFSPLKGGGLHHFSLAWPVSPVVKVFLSFCLSVFLINSLSAYIYILCPRQMSLFSPPLISIFLSPFQIHKPANKGTAKKILNKFGSDKKSRNTRRSEKCKR